LLDSLLQEILEKFTDVVIKGKKDIEEFRDELIKTEKEACDTVSDRT